MLPTPPIDATTGDLITTTHTALVGLDTRLASLPESQRRPIAHALTCHEAAHSAAVDNVITTPRALATTIATSGADLAAHTTYALEAALTSGRQARTQATPQRAAASLEALGAIHRAQNHTTHAVHAGRLRAHTSTTSDISADQIPERLTAVAEYARHTWANPIATAAVAYAELHLIEPYDTGTPRAARAWITHLMAAWNIVDTITVPLSTTLDQATLATALARYRDGNPHAIITAIADGILTSCARSAALVDELLAESAAMRSALDTLGTRTDSHAWPMTDHLLGHPITTSSAAGTAVGTDRYGGWTAATKLAEAGLLTQTTKDNTNVWEAPGTLTVWENHFPQAITPARAVS